MTGTTITVSLASTQVVAISDWPTAQFGLSLMQSIEMLIVQVRPSAAVRFQVLVIRLNAPEFNSGDFYVRSSQKVLGHVGRQKLLTSQPKYFLKLIDLPISSD